MNTNTQTDTPETEAIALQIEIGIRQSEACNDKAAEDTFRTSLEAIGKLERERDAALREVAELRQVNEMNKATAERFGKALERIAKIKNEAFAG